MIFGVAANVSITKLFLAGIFPGIWLAMGLWATWWWLTPQGKTGAAAAPVGWRDAAGHAQGGLGSSPVS